MLRQCLSMEPRLARNSKRSSSASASLALGSSFSQYRLVFSVFPPLKHYFCKVLFPEQKVTQSTPQHSFENFSAPPHPKAMAQGRFVHFEVTCFLLKTADKALISSS